MQPPPPFEPAITVSALALRNLKKLPFLRFRLQQSILQSNSSSLYSNSITDPILKRAQWLEYGVGIQTALNAAALAQITESLPAALAATVPQSVPSSQNSKQQSSSKETNTNPLNRNHTNLSNTSTNSQSSTIFLWVFGTTSILNQAKQLLQHTFQVDLEGIWTPQSPEQYTFALTRAIHRALCVALEAEGAIRVADQLLHMPTSLAYSFLISLGHGKNPHILIRITVHHLKARFLTDDDHTLFLSENIKSFPVFTSPLGIKASLSRRPVAGDDLTISVLQRWKEAGLLPNTNLKDSAVIFVQLENGVQVPLPRACILTKEPVRRFQDVIGKDVTIPDTNSSSKSSSNSGAVNLKSNIALWKSRKRPRSPNTDCDNNQSTHQQQHLQTSSKPIQPESKPILSQPSTSVQKDHASDMIPTAESLNAALEKARKTGTTDPIPSLRHPLVEPILPPSFSQNSKNMENEENNSKTTDEANLICNDKTTPERLSNSNTKDTRVKDEKETLDVATDSVEADWLGKTVKQEPESSHVPNSMDEYLLDGGANGADSCGFDPGPVNIHDFPFDDDDVTGFFGSGIEQKQVTDTGLGQDEDNNKSKENSDSGGRESGRKNSENSHNGNRGSNPDNRMDVDTDLQNSAGQPRKSDSSWKNKDMLPTSTVVKLALNALHHPLPTARPNKEQMVTNLVSYYEEDLIRRKKTRLSAKRSIKKRQRFNQKAAIALHKELIKASSESSGILQIPDSSPLQPYPSESYSQNPYKSQVTSLSSLFVPTRLVKAYGRLNAQQRASKQCLDIIRRKVEEETDSDEYDSSPSSDQSTVTARTEIIDTLAIDDDNLETGKNTQDVKRSSEIRGDSDTRQILDTVTVDCVSACYMLAEYMATQFTHGSTNSDTTPGGNNDVTLSPGSIRDDEVTKSNPSSNINLGSSKGSIPPVVTRQANPSHLASPSNRASNKKDRELLTLLSLLEMQLFSSPDLDLLPEANSNTSEEPSKAQIEEELSSQADEGRNVSSATMRRVLLGLPRALETSQSLGSCLTELRSAGEDSVGPTVQGPLSVNEFLGGSASVFPLSTPRVCIGYSKEWMETSSGALPLWEKSGYEPYSERKNVEYVALAPKDIESDVRLFLRDVSAAYEECSFGRHAPMPFDAVMPIASSVSNVGVQDQGKRGASLSDSDKAMVQQYHLAVTGLCTKLTAVTRDHRKNSTGSPTNIVVYVVSPFMRYLTAANVALMKAVLPLISTIPGTVSSNSGIPPILNLPSAPWRSSPSSKSVVSITIRLLPREIVDLQNSAHTNLEQLLDRPFRPQIMKAVSFAVFSAIRNKRVRSPTLEGEIAGVLSRSSLMPDDLMSPMTPELLAESPGGTAVTPASPIGPGNEDISGTGNPSPGAVSMTSVDQSSALSTSLLHEPAIVLAGVGKHMGQTDGKMSIIMHLAYTFSESSSRYIFAWTDERGEMLDIASVPVLGSGICASRRKAFWGMWARGQRWRMPYVENVHTTISKLGTIDSNETEDWNRVLNKVITMESGSAEKKNEEPRRRRIVQRFPVPEQSKGEDISDAYPDLLTPATPGVSQPTTSGTTNKTTVSIDVKLPPTSSITLLTVCDANTHLFMEKPNVNAQSDKRDFAIVSDMSLSTGHQVQANTILARFEESGIGAIELSIIRHYGNAIESEEMSDKRSLWDCYDIETIATAIANNFHELRYVASPPSWPQKRWLRMYPVHLEAVRSLKTGLRLVQNHAQGVPQTQSRS